MINYLGSTADTGDCEYNLANLTPVASISGYDNLTPNSYDAVIQHIAEVIIENQQISPYRHYICITQIAHFIVSMIFSTTQECKVQ